MLNKAITLFGLLLGLVALVLLILSGLPDSLQRSLVAKYVIPLFRYSVTSIAMEPNFFPRDKVSIDSSKDFKRGDAVLIKKDGLNEYYISRLIGLPGDRIEIRSTTMYVNHKPVLNKSVNISLCSPEKVPEYKELGLTPECYEESIDGRTFIIIQSSLLVKEDSKEPMFVPRNGKYFVLGDNRDFALDSRASGFVDEKNIIGKVSHGSFKRD